MTHDNVFDAALNYIGDNADVVWILASTSAAGDGGYDSAKANMLASVTIPGGGASAIFTIGDGDVSGRKAAVAIISGISVETGGTAKNLAFVNVSASAMYHMTETSSQVLTGGNLVNTSPFDIEFEDPSAP